MGGILREAGGSVRKQVRSMEFELTSSDNSLAISNKVEDRCDL